MLPGIPFSCGFGEGPGCPRRGARHWRQGQISRKHRCVSQPVHLAGGQPPAPGEQSEDGVPGGDGSPMVMGVGQIRGLWLRPSTCLWSPRSCQMAPTSSWEHSRPTTFPWWWCGWSCSWERSSLCCRRPVSSPSATRSSAANPASGLGKEHPHADHDRASSPSHSACPLMPPPARVGCWEYM